MEKLNNAHVFLAGLGGVGSFAAEALCRSSVGNLYLADCDAISPSNLNRQLFALNSTIGRKKTSLAFERLKDISLNCNITLFDEMLTAENISDFIKPEADYVIDAIDNVTAKIAIAQFCENNGIPHISVMGTGNKTDPTCLSVTDIYKTENCPLARAVRRLCRKKGIKSLKVVYSAQEGVHCGRTPSSMIFVPASAGLLAAREAVMQIINM